MNFGSTIYMYMYMYNENFCVITHPIDQNSRAMCNKHRGYGDTFMLDGPATEQALACLASSPGLLRGKGEKAWYPLYAHVLAVNIQILNNLIMYGYCLVYLPFDLNSSCSGYLEMAGLDRLSFEWDFMVHVAQATLSIELVYRHFYGKLYGKCSACTCSGYQPSLPSPPQKAWGRGYSLPSLSLLQHQCQHQCSSGERTSFVYTLRKLDHRASQEARGSHLQANNCSLSYLFSESGIYYNSINTWLELAGARMSPVAS